MAYIQPNHELKQLDIVLDDYIVRVGNLLTITRVSVMSHGGNQSYLMELTEKDLSGVIRVFSLDYTEFNSSMETSGRLLNQNGYVLSSFKFNNHLREYISQQLQRRLSSGKLEYHHTNLGFTQMSDTSRTFLLGDTVYKGKRSKFVDRDAHFVKGEATRYDAFLAEHIYPYFETRLALILGLSSVAASDLKLYGDLGTIVLNLSGRSSTGKTTITQFMASLWGSPLISNFGIVRTFNATVNSLVHTFTGTNGVPLIIDDATSMGVKDLSSFVYNVAAGEDKLRLNPNITLRDSRGSWSGLCTITSETSLMDFSARTSGTIPRLLEFDDITWTQSGHHAKAIKRSILNDYGHVGRDFVERYMATPREDIEHMFDACEQEIEAGITATDQYTSRIVAKLATIYLTAKLYQQFYPESQFDTDDIREYLITFESGKVPIRSIEALAMDIIKEFIIINQNRLAIKQSNGQIPQLTSGGIFIGYRHFTGQSVGKQEEKVEITIIASIIREHLQRYNIYQWNNFIEYLRSNKFVKVYGNNKVSEKDHHLSARAITFTFTRDKESDLMRWYGSSSHINYGYPPLHKTDYNDDTAIDDIFRD